MTLVKELNSELQDLCTKLNEVSKPVTVSSESQVTKSPKSHELTQSSEVHKLRKQVQDLTTTVTLSVSQGKPRRTPQFQGKPVTVPVRNRVAKDQDDYFCYRCGEYAHCNHVSGH